jgi:hypothetical protein
VVDQRGDQILIAEGTTYSASLPNMNDKTGFSVLYPVVIQSYDPADPLNEAKYGRATTNRPTFTWNDVHYMTGGGGGPTNITSKLAIRGLAFTPADHSSIFFFPPSWATNDYILIENCIGPSTSVGSSQRGSAVGRGKCFIIRNSAFHGAWSPTGRTSNIYIDWTINPTFEDDVPYHGGWKEGASRDAIVTVGGCADTGGPGVGTPAGAFCHAYYIQEDCINTVARRNFVADSASDGGQNRGASLIQGNFYLDNPQASSVGSGAQYNGTCPNGVDLNFSFNVILGDADITSGDPRGTAIGTVNGKNGSRSSYNVVARSRSPTGGADPNQVCAFNTGALFPQPSYMAWDHNIAYLWSDDTHETIDQNHNPSGFLTAQLHATYANNYWDKSASGSNLNISSLTAPNPYTAAQLYAALTATYPSITDKASLVAYAVAHPEAHVQRTAVALMQAGYGLTMPALEDLFSTINIVSGQPDGSIFIGARDGSTLAIISGGPTGLTVSSDRKGWFYDGTTVSAGSGTMVVRETLDGNTHDSSIPWTTSVAPVLSSISVSSIGTTTATINVTTNTGSGTLYYVVAGRDSGVPDLLPGTVTLGFDDDYTPATDFGGKSGSVAISSTGAKTINLTSLTSGHTYPRGYLVQKLAGAPAIYSVVGMISSFTTS